MGVLGPAFDSPASDFFEWPCKVGFEFLSEGFGVEEALVWATEGMRGRWDRKGGVERGMFGRVVGGRFEEVLW